MSDPLCCPGCGCDTFSQLRVVSATFIVHVNEHGLEDVSEEFNDRGEDDTFVLNCQDCGREYQPDTTELITTEAYNAAE